MSTELSGEDKRRLLELARSAMEAAVRGDDPPAATDRGLSPALQEAGCCFVTLYANHKLRGCIGGLRAELPLYQEVCRRAAQAALHDHRFAPVTPAELASIDIEISVLTPPLPLEYGTSEELLERLRPGVDGVVLRHGRHQATFLPQVWTQAPDPRQFLALLCEKLGVPAWAWQRTHLEVSVYQVIEMTEAEFGLTPPA